MSEPGRQFDTAGNGEWQRRAEFLQRRYDSLIGILPDAVFVQDEAGNLIDANAAGERLSGYRHTELLCMKAADLLLSPAIAPTAGAPFETELVTRGGMRRAVLVYASEAHQADGSVIVQSIVREPDSCCAETRFRVSARSLTEMTLAYGMDRRLTFANAAAENLTGYSRAELEEQEFLARVHPEDRPHLEVRWENLFQATPFSDEEYRLITKDGRVRWIAASWEPAFDRLGRQSGVQGRERDVTERRMAEETLRQSEQILRINEERYHTLFENSPFPMWEEDFSQVKFYVEGLKAVVQGGDLREHLTANRDAVIECVRRVRILDVNRAARDFYGVRDKQPLLDDLTTLFDDPSYDIFREEVLTLAEGGSIFKCEFQARVRAGEERTVSMIVSLVPTPDSDWSRVIVSFFDITDRKRLEEQLLQSQKLESLGRLAGGIAHDFNNLLTVINGYSDLLLRGLAADNPMRRGLAEIQNAGTRGAELTQQLLAFSRKQVAKVRPIDLNALVRESEGMLRRVIGEDVVLVIQLDPEAGTIKGDRGQIHQVLMNLVVNGREAMPRGGTISIETRNVWLGAGLAEEEPFTPGSRPCVLLRIGDTGVGMDAHTRQHLFEPFFTTKQVGKGTGLGLSTVFGIVTQSEGHIAVASEPGMGSVFSVYLPRHWTPAKPDLVLELPPQPAKGSGAVLVVEDQEEVRRLTCGVLRAMGYDVLEASSGMEAIELAKRHGHAIQLLLSDVIMPGMNGRELAAQLASVQPRMKVIYMSGYTDRIMSDTGVLDGSVEFLQKPFSPDKLVNMVRRALEAGGA